MPAGAELLRLALVRTGRVRFRARGLSMRPFLRDGDVVSVVRAPAEAIEIDDVVCYERECSRLVVHRVVGRVAADLVAKGDALGWIERVPAARVLGRVASVERRGARGRFRAWVGRLAARARRMMGHA